MADRPLRVALVADLAEERWLSMDRVAEMLFAALREGHRGEIEAELIRPPMRRRFSPAGSATEAGARFTADRVLNRFMDYPLRLRRLRTRFDVFHVVDHSYAQLVHTLPQARTVVTCHDLDAFRSVLWPEQEPRRWPFRTMSRHILRGLVRAARVACVTAAVRDQLLTTGLLEPERVSVRHPGIDDLFSPEPNVAADAEVQRLLGPPNPARPELLHVGSAVPRKRVDVLLRVFAGVRAHFPEARLVRVGPLSRQQERLASELGIADGVVRTPFLDRAVLAAMYRRAALVLLPSEREGFGLPVIEAMACGVPVVASDLPVLREVGGSVAIYAPVAAEAQWTATVVALLRERSQAPECWEARRTAAVRRASRFTWRAYAAGMTELYHSVALR